MELSNFFSGIAVVIDDEIGQAGANINDLIKQIESRNIPIFTSKKLLELDYVQHLGNASFLILDWKLVQDDINSNILEGVKMPDNLAKISIEKNIEFLKSVMLNFFSPIFIFTNEEKEIVFETLRENGLYQDDKPNVILVKNKNELIRDDDLFISIEEWIKENPSIYVLKKWEKEYQNAKNRLFLDFYNRSSIWPRVLWKSYEKDKVDASRELAEVIMKNVYSRMAPFEFNSSFLETDRALEMYTELRKVLEGERFIKVDQLKPEEIFTGDVFRFSNQVWPYLLNIRAQCDLRGKNPELYCLKGRVLEENQINSNDGIPFQEGEFREKKNQAIVSCIDDGKIIEFSFRNLIINKWNNLKNDRIGRLLPPYITRIQQLYSLYFQRIGLPRTPDEILSESKNAAAVAEVSTIMAETGYVAAAKDS